MATYEYECSKCRKPFTAEMSFRDYDRHKSVKCPKCDSRAVKQLPSAAHVQTAKKS